MVHFAFLPFSSNGRRRMGNKGKGKEWERRKREVRGEGTWKGEREGKWT